VRRGHLVLASDALLGDIDVFQADFLDVSHGLSPLMGQPDCRVCSRLDAGSAAASPPVSASQELLWHWGQGGRLLTEPTEISLPHSVQR
jgi:hypothetical protein